jgi:hypothetical protein
MEGDERLTERHPAEHLLVIFSDTGDEHSKTYSHIERCEKRCDDRDDIDFVHVTPDMGYHTDAWQSLTDHYEENNTIGSKAYVKSCSSNLKIAVLYKYIDDYIGDRFGFTSGRKRAMYSYAEHFGKLPVMIGIAEGEESRAKGNDTGPKWMIRTVRRIYPLIEMEMGRLDCQEVIREAGREPPRPSMCRHCPFKTDLQVLLMSKRDPEGFEEWVRLERQKLEAWADHCEEKGVDNYGGVERRPYARRGGRGRTREIQPPEPRGNGRAGFLPRTLHQNDLLRRHLLRKCLLQRQEPADFPAGDAE